MSAVVLVPPVFDLPALLSSPKFGPWKVEQNQDGSFAIVSREGRNELRYGHFNNRLLAVNLAAAENAKPDGAPRCICDDAFPGPIEARHCPACREKARPA